MLRYLLIVAFILLASFAGTIAAQTTATTATAPTGATTPTPSPVATTPAQSDSPKITDWLAAIFAAIAATAALAGLYSVRLLRIQLERDHDRSRRERAVELIQHWTVSLGREASSARKLVQKLDAERTKKLFNQEPMSMAEDLKDYAEACLHPAGITVTPKDGQIHLDGGACSIIRWYALSYVNTLESIFVAWRHNIADRDIIEEQFNYLLDPASGHNALEVFRTVCGGRKVFPATHEFMNRLKESGEILAPGKQRL
jgi:hypothetical protein